MSYLGRSAKLSLKAQEKVSFLATAGQTSKTGLSYTPSFVEVYVNGVLLTDTTDFTATNGNSITFTVALLVNDEVTVISLKTFTVADHYNKTEADTLLAAKAPIASPVFTGNVLVGKTSADSGATVGFEVNGSTNKVYMTDSGSAPLILNRLSTTGAILGFKQDGTTVGSIGIEAGGLVIDGESGHTGLRFANDSVLPRDNGTTTNGADDLGSTTARWKDLYLSGGVYLGGTGSANLLDDYEAAAFTPSVRDAVSGGNSQALSGTFKYTKIGRLVHFQVDVANIVTSGLTGTNRLYITGLPFTASYTSVEPIGSC